MTGPELDLDAFPADDAAVVAHERELRTWLVETGARVRAERADGDTDRPGHDPDALDDLTLDDLGWSDVR